jgi:glutathione S-transferase
VIGWHSFLGPMVRQKGSEELERLLARIPTKERRIAWSTAARATFTEEQLSAARRRIGEWTRVMDDRLAVSPYLAGDAYSLADLVAFANFYALPKTMPEFATRANAPHYWDWLKRLYARPASRQTFAASRSLARRAFEIAAELERDA